MDRDTIDSFFYAISRVVDAIYEDEDAALSALNSHGK